MALKLLLELTRLAYVVQTNGKRDRKSVRNSLEWLKELLCIYANIEITSGLKRSKLNKIAIFFPTIGHISKSIKHS